MRVSLKKKIKTDTMCILDYFWHHLEPCYHHHHHLRLFTPLLAGVLHCWQVSSTAVSMLFDLVPHESTGCQLSPLPHLSIVFSAFIFHFSGSILLLSLPICCCSFWQGVPPTGLSFYNYLCNVFHFCL